MSRKVEIPLLTDDAWTAGTYEILRMFFFHMSKSKKTYAQVADEAGLNPESFKQWKAGGTMPSLDSILRCFAALGLTLVVKRASDAAFAHEDYFEMDDEFERQKARKNGERPPPKRGLPEWIEANSIPDDACLDPTPEDIEAEKRERAIPRAERLKARAPIEARKLEDRRRLFEAKRRKKRGRTREKSPVEKPSPK